MLAIVIALALALSFGSFVAWSERTVDGIRHELHHYVHVPAPWSGEAHSWLRSDEERRLTPVRGLLLLILLTLLVVAVIVLGWLKALGVVLTSLLCGWFVGDIGREREAQMGPALRRASTTVRMNAQRFRATADPERARAADDFAARIDAFAQAYSSVSTTAFTDFQTPGYVAALLESYYLPEHLVAADTWMPPDLRRESPPRSGDDSDLDLPSWLEREIRPLSTHAIELARVKLLEGIRQELLAGGGAKYGDLARVQEMVMELRRPA